MKFPFYVCELSNEQTNCFKQHFAKEDGRFCFEGIWFRNQRPENKEASGYKDETTKNRRYIQFYDVYETIERDDKNYLAMTDSFVYVSSTYQKEELEAYKHRILNALNKANFKKCSENIYQKDSLCVSLHEYDEHPKNIEAGVEFPTDYYSLDVIVQTKDYDCTAENDRMWTLSTKLFRLPESRGNPTYINSLDEIEKFLPAQVEMGCGPSISVGIPPLHSMHETYKVQNHITHKFYFGKEDDLIVSIIKNPQKMYEKFSYVPKVIINAKPNKAYQTFAKLYHNGVFTGTVLNNNFDRLVKRFDIDEYILRIYDKGTYLPKINFDPRAKSLICFGTHADRRQVQRQARAVGKQVIFVDPEGFYNASGFESYPIEAPQTGDLIYKKTFEEAMEEFANKFLKEDKLMDIELIKDEVLDYLQQNYDLQDSNILRKYNHIQSVANNCLQLAKWLNLSESDQNILYVTGLLHDYGRFEQWKRYNTYNDSVSCDHAVLASQMLFEKNQIKQFSILPQFYPIIKTAIYQHNKTAIDKELTDQKELLFCKILRDADKIDLYKLNMSGATPTFTNLDGVTKEVLEKVAQKKWIDKQYIKTKLDRALLPLASMYDLNFDYSISKLYEMGYFEKIEARFLPELNETDARLLKEIIKTVLNDLKTK